MKIQKKLVGGGSGGEGRGRVRGGQGGCEQRIEVFCENSKKKWGEGAGVGFVKIQKKIFFFFWGGGRGVGESGWGGQGGCE